ncbi:hypothetical protein Lal_00038998 [Lupinus albus]|nr:hypothetical protein Lal_00038998 [Lupinus albus]
MIGRWVGKRQQEKNQLEGIRMLCWTNGHVRQDRSSNKCIREKVEVTPIAEKRQGKRKIENRKLQKVELSETGRFVQENEYGTLLELGLLTRKTRRLGRKRKVWPKMGAEMCEHRIVTTPPAIPSAVDLLYQLQQTLH